MATPDNGYIKLYRDLLNNSIAQKPNYLAVWVYILLSANHRDNYTIINGEKTLIEAGSFIGSLQKIAKYFGISINTVKYIVDYFEHDKMLYTNRTPNYTIFKVLNWDNFQTCTRGEHEENTRRTRGETNKNDKNVKNEKNKAFKDSNDEAEKIYNAYPRKTQRAAAIRAISKALKSEPFENLLQAVSEYAASPKVKSTPKEFIPYPATWFNSESWKDDRSEWGLSAKAIEKQETLWGKLRSEIKKQGLITDDEIVEWFENSEVTIEFDWLIVGVDSFYRVNHIRENYADRLLQAGKKIFAVESIDIVLTGGLAEAAVSK
jgi:hypothetical protein